MKEFKTYFDKLKEEEADKSTELTFRPALKNFLEDLFNNLKASHHQKIIRGVGQPDFTCFKNKIKIGYIETKDIGTNLEKELESEQIKRYSEGAIPNLIITDYLRFILYRNQKILMDVILFDEHSFKKGNLVLKNETINNFKQLIHTFLDYNLPTIRTATELAIELSKKAKILRYFARGQLEEDLETVKNSKNPSSIYDFYEAFGELIKNPSVSDCVDAYSQTITYGLFLSKIGSGDGLDRNTAVNFIPSNIKIIKKIFMNITGDVLPPHMFWIIDDIIDILNISDIQKILSEFSFEGKNYRDPFIHFYEDFLKEYDPEKRKKLGIYYTPEPVVSFITNSINEILKKEFGKKYGFADDSVTALDPATGTGTFVANSFIIALKEMREKGLSGIKKDKIKNHLLKHFYAFEILVSPYVISHLKLSTLLKMEGYELDYSDRIQIYLTNTLDPSELTHHLGLFFRELNQETITANEIKLKKQILVIMGNPPYFKSSSNNSTWIRDILKPYKEGLNERRLGNLDDDYVKFIRFAQWKIEQNKIGVVGFITNNSYIESPTFRKMRECLLKTFNKVFILNLHGNSKINETCPDGSKDENVFNIQQGVAICLLIKNKERDNNKIDYYDLWGLRDDKYNLLNTKNIYNLGWRSVDVDTKFYFFLPKDFKGSEKYNKFYSLTEIFSEFNSGLETKKDDFLVNFTKGELKEKLNIFVSKSFSKNEVIDKLKIKDIIIKDAKGKSKYEFEIDSKREIIRKEGVKEEFIVKYLHRPFDYRWVYFNKDLISRHRSPLSLSMLKNNLAICVSRFTSMKDEFSSILLADTLNDLKYCEYSRGCYFFPLYVYNVGKKESQLTITGDLIKAKSGKQPNFREEFLNFLSEKYSKKEINPEQIFGYIYSVLHSPTYRKKYKEFLKTDFPRILFVDYYKTFIELSKLGNELIELHLMKKHFFKNIAKFEKSGTNEVEFIKYDNKKIFINDEQYFSQIPEEIWNFYIGGYQVLDKWLKSRKGRKLTDKEIEAYIEIINVISETLSIMEKIDRLYLKQNI